jgi:hypothetical protein
MAHSAVSSFAGVALLLLTLDCRNSQSPTIYQNLIDYQASMKSRNPKSSPTLTSNSAFMTPRCLLKYQKFMGM